MKLVKEDFNTLDIELAMLAQTLSLQYCSYAQKFLTKGWGSGKRVCEISQYKNEAGEKAITVECYGRPRTCMQIASFVEAKTGIEVNFVIKADNPIEEY